MDKQYGFRPGKSTIVSSIKYITYYILPYIFEAFNVRSQISAILLNFFKAFVKVNHNSFIRILREFGFGEPLLS